MRRIVRKRGNNEKIVYGRGEDTTISRKKWINRKGRRRKMMRSIRRAQ